MFKSSYFDARYLRQCLLRLVLVIVAMKLTGGSGFVIVLPLFLFAYSKSKNEDMLFWMVVSIIMVIACPQLVPKNSVFAYSQRFLMVMMGLMMGMQLAGRRTSRVLSPLLMILPYLGIMVISSLQGWSPVVSFLKLFLFLCVYFAYIGVSNRVVSLQGVRILKVRSVMLSFACFIILGSVCLIPFPAYSIMQLNEFQSLEALPLSLFQGITSHSQTLGPLVAMLAIMLFADMVFGLRRGNKFYILLLLLCPVLIFKASSRTAMGTLVAGIATVVLIMMNARGVNRAWRGKVLSAMLGLAALVSAMLLATSGGRRSVAEFVVKYNSEDKAGQVSMDDVLSTRRGKWEEGMNNFKQSPVFGNGFQVSEDMVGLEMSMKNILTAPVEKSVWVTAVLEEGGVIGFIFFMVFVVSLITKLFQMRAYMGLATFCGMMIINLGEFVMFSMSGVGGVLWLVVIISLAMDAERIKCNRLDYARFPRAW